jgi:hypothetical protein
VLLGPIERQRRATGAAHGWASASRAGEVQVAPVVGERPFRHDRSVRDMGRCHAVHVTLSPIMVVGRARRLPGRCSRCSPGARTRRTTADRPDRPAKIAARWHLSALGRTRRLTSDGSPAVDRCEITLIALATALEPTSDRSPSSDALARRVRDETLLSGATRPAVAPFRLRTVATGSSHRDQPQDGSPRGVDDPDRVPRNAPTRDHPSRPWWATTRTRDDHQ